MIFDFHHHKKTLDTGFYNLSHLEAALDRDFSVGLHPQDIKQNTWRQDCLWVERLAHLPQAKMIGECGLDSRGSASDVLQKEVFLWHVHLANRLNKPMVIHCVRRFSSLVFLCKTLHSPKIVHGFHKKESVAKELLFHGFYLSFGASLLNDLSLQKVFYQTPLSRVFLETDNSDVSIEQIYNKASEIKQMAVENKIQQNKIQLFR